MTLTVGVNIKFPYRAVYRPYRTFKKRLARPYRFILLGVTQYYCYTRSEYRAESSLKWIFLLCLYHCCSSRLFLTRPFRFSLLIVSALLVDRSASVRRLFMLFLSINRFSPRQFRSSSSITFTLLLMDFGRS